MKGCVECADKEFIRCQFISNLVLDPLKFMKLLELEGKS